jgi:hypothetical protein
MNQTLIPPSPAVAFRAFLVRAWDEPESRSNLVGVAGVLLAILLYILALLFPPSFLRYEPMSVDRPHATPRTFSIEMEPDVFTKPAPPPPPSRFVETNPDAPDNVPDKTINFGAQNQQAAQEKPTPDGKSDTPAIDGKQENREITQIVTGQLSKPIEHVEAQPPPIDVPVADSTISPPKAEQNPLPGFEKKEGESKDSYGSNIAKIPEANARPIPQKIEGAKNVPLVEGATVIQPSAVDPKRPRPRPQVVKTQQVRPAILIENKVGTEKIGALAFDAKWSNYGAYLQRMIETVQVQWERILTESRTAPPSGSYVVVRFIIDSDGRIAKIVEVDSHSTEQAARACVSGITDRAPYGPWTDDMKAVLGERQEMTFSFYYH